MSISRQPHAKLRLSTSGVRGFIGASLTPAVAIDLAASLGTFLEEGTVVVGMDTRNSSEMLHPATLAGLLSTGCRVIDFGVCPTPVMQWAIPRLKAQGGLAISGGHNGAGWNAITVLGSDGAFMDPLGGESILGFYHSQDFIKQDYQHIGAVEAAPEGLVDDYFNALAAFLDVDAIAKAGFTVVIDPVGGAGCRFLEPFAERLGFALVAVHGEPTGYLARDPEPRPRNALHLASIVPHVKADIAFVLSSDMGRVSFVSDTGEPLSEERSFPLLLDYFLMGRKGPVITNCCTTRMVDAVAQSHDVPVVKTGVGQSALFSALADEEGIIAGEGNGSVGIPGFSLGFDGFLMMGLMLERMAKQKMSVSDMVAAMPPYVNVKRHVYCSTREAYRGLEALKENAADIAPGGQVNLTEGVRIDWADGWVHARLSQTENIVRIISEARDRETAERWNDAVARCISASTSLEDFA